MIMQLRFTTVALYRFYGTFTFAAELKPIEQTHQNEVVPIHQVWGKSKSNPYHPPKYCSGISVIGRRKQLYSRQFVL